MRDCGEFFSSSFISYSVNSSIRERIDKNSSISKLLLYLGVTTATLLSTMVWLSVPAAIPALAQTAATCNGVAATIVGSSGSDDIEGTPGRDVIATLGGDDKIRAEGGNDLICGGPGNDDIRGDAGSDRVFGDSGNDIIRGETGNDQMNGGAGNDNIRGDEGTDSTNGGTGFDDCRSETVINCEKT
jgi:Ca2+-binding RTX toxin-like protein